MFYRDGPFTKKVSFVGAWKNVIYSKRENNPFKQLERDKKNIAQSYEQETLVLTNWKDRVWNISPRKNSYIWAYLRITISKYGEGREECIRGSQCYKIMWDTKCP